MPARSPQGRYWLLTIPVADWSVPEALHDSIQYLKGQQEQGHGDNAYHHWQLMVAFKTKVRLAHVKQVFTNTAHAELSRSSAADDYVWKEDTAVAGTRFELGRRAIRRNNSKDWEAIWTAASEGRLGDVPADVRVTHYRTIKQIEKDHLRPVAIERQVKVYWGRPGTGKSRLAWQEAGLEAYPKDPCTKFWDGYQGGENVVIDEFRGDINISHILRWFDRYPVNVECKFGAVTLRATRIWITSNKDPRDWYPDVNEDTKNALLRRLDITHFDVLREFDD